MHYNFILYTLWRLSFLTENQNKIKIKMSKRREWVNGWVGLWGI